MQDSHNWIKFEGKLDGIRGEGVEGIRGKMDRAKLLLNIRVRKVKRLKRMNENTQGQLISFILDHIYRHIFPS